MLIIDRVQSGFEHFGLIGFGFVRGDVDFDVRVRAFSLVHCHQVAGLFDAHCELRDRQKQKDGL